MHNLKVQYRPLASLRAHDRNARTHSKAQVRQLADSITRFGWTNPVLTDGEGRIIAGHGRVEAAKLLGMKTVPSIRLDRLTEAEKRAYVIADNRLAEKAGWDRELLAIELKYIAELDVNFDLTLTGFETPELDVLFEDTGQGGDDPADEVPDIDHDRPAVSRVGDLWRLGRHRLLCGDARTSEHYATLLDGAVGEMAITDPPYNVRIGGNVCGLGSIRHREFPMASGEMNEAEYTEFLSTVFKRLVDYTADGSIHFVYMDWRHLFEALSAGRGAYAGLKNLVVWNKSNGGMGTFYRSKHELILVFKNGKAPHINNFELGQGGRYRTNIWDYPGVNTMRPGRLDELAMHPTVKPVAMIAEAIRDCSRRGGIILDPFAGSGTCVLAAERTGRRAFAMELDPYYVDVAIRRWQAFIGKEAVFAANGAPFAAIEDERCDENSPPTPILGRTPTRTTSPAATARKPRSRPGNAAGSPAGSDP